MSTPYKLGWDTLKIDPVPCDVCNDVLRRAFCAPAACTSLRHSHFSYLQKSAENGCNLCRIIRHSILVWECGGVPDFPLEQLDELSVVLTVFPPSPDHWRLMRDQKIRIKLVDKNGYSSMAVGDPNLSMVDPQIDWEEKERYHPSKVAQSIAEAIPVIRRWIKDCVDEHGGCEEHGDDADPSTFPTRLIDVGMRRQDGSWPDPKLHISNSNQHSSTTDRYLALSYRWGVDHHASCTTDDRLPQFQERIPWEGIPRTIQDAISITRSLDERYLWVDALCIIQDRNRDSEDWGREVGRVGAYYQNALVTLSVNDVVSCNEGIFKTTPGSRSAWDFEISGSTLTLESQHKGCAQYSLLPVFPSLEDTVDLSQLQKRGWVIQERLFSSRIVHLGKYCMTWECNAFHAAEWVHSPVHMLPYSRFLSKRRSWQLFSRKDQLDSEWLRFIEYYSGTSLTKETDRLPAIAAFASALEKQHGKDPNQQKPEYIAGIWRESLPGSLAWSTDLSPVQSRESPQTKINEPSQIPSWSWASACGKVWFKRWTLAGAIMEGFSKSKDGRPILRLRCDMLHNVFEKTTPVDGDRSRLYPDHHGIVDAWQRYPERYSLALLSTLHNDYAGLILELIDADAQIYKRVGLFRVSLYRLVAEDKLQSLLNSWKKRKEEEVRNSVGLEAPDSRVSISLV